MNRAINRRGLRDFLVQSNQIEGIDGVSDDEIDAAEDFLARAKLTTADVQRYVYATAGHDATLRARPGMNVSVGSHLPPHGGPWIIASMDELLDKINIGSINAYEAHIEYETLHPFMDGNGRSGRLIWLWHTLRGQAWLPPLGFLHRWYYDSLNYARKRGTS
jgi:hypothetical protein